MTQPMRNYKENTTCESPSDMAKVDLIQQNIFSLIDKTCKIEQEKLTQYLSETEEGHTYIKVAKTDWAKEQEESR